MIIIYSNFTIIMKINVMFLKNCIFSNNYQEKKTTWPIIIFTTINVIIQSNVISWIIMFKNLMYKFTF